MIHGVIIDENKTVVQGLRRGDHMGDEVWPRAEASVEPDGGTLPFPAPPTCLIPYRSLYPAFAGRSPDRSAMQRTER